uniref:RagB/SusD family nutrient uptake outer membrane protein n=1 Tax=Phocaeicola coprocola TaxID=310298 RepID=UPI004038ECCF
MKHCINKYILGSLLFGAMTGVTSCNLDYNPVDTYSDITEGVQTNTGEKLEFQTKADVESALTAIYELMKNRMEHWYLDLLLIGDSHSDNAYGGTTDSQAMPFENNSIEGSSPILERDWNRYLEDVAQANRIICNIDKVPDDTFTETQRKTITAQAKIFRALIWFDMVRLWGNIPLITSIAPDITAENIDDIYDQYFPAQADAATVYKQIETDLIEALQYAPDNDPTDKTKFSKSVAKAMLAKIYAEKPLRDYSQVIKYCDLLEQDGFDLVEDFSDLWTLNDSGTDLKIRNTKESILEANFPSTGGNWCAWMFGRDLLNYDYSFTWAKWVTPSRDLINLFNRENDTKRLNESVVYYECDWSIYYPSNHYAFMYKCRAGVSSIIKLRYADLLLLKAEAYLWGAEQNLSGAADIIDKIRQRAGLQVLSSSVRNNESALKTAYLNERRMELAFEGQRWFDLCRLDKVEEVMNNLQDEGRNSRVNPFTANSYLLAIPQTALDQNEKLKQNPGY